MVRLEEAKRNQSGLVADRQGILHLPGAFPTLQQNSLRLPFVVGLPVYAEALLMGWRGQDRLSNDFLVGVNCLFCFHFLGLATGLFEDAFYCWSARQAHLHF